MQRHAAQQLDIKMSHFHHPLAALTDDGERLWQHHVERLSRSDAALEFLRFIAQLVVAQFFVVSFEAIDLIDGFTVGFEQAVVAAAENFGQDVGGHTCEAAVVRRKR